MNREGILSEVAREVWAIQSEWLESALATVASRNMTPVAATPSQPAKSAVAVVPVYGPISKRPNFLTLLFGGATTEAISTQLKSLVADPGVKAIVLDIDSPGGTVGGMIELAEEIRGMRGTKPIFAVANPLMASAAYCIGAQAGEVIATPSSLTGSIGVFMLHMDYSRMLEQGGVKPTFIQFGENKTLGNPMEPLSDDARSEFQRIVDSAGRDFVRAVANGRKVTQSTVMEKFGQGLIFTAQDAVRHGLADRILTLDEVLAGLGASTSAARGRSRAQQWRDIQRVGLA